MSSDTGFMVTHWAMVCAPSKCAHSGCCQEVANGLPFSCRERWDYTLKPHRSRGRVAGLATVVETHGRTPRSECRESNLRPQPTATPRLIRIRPRLQIRWLNPHRRQTRTHLLAMDTHMMQRLHDNHRCVRLVGAIIQKRKTLAVNRFAQKPFPPGTTFLRTRGKLPQVISLTISHCPDGTATTKTRH